MKITHRILLAFIGLVLFGCCKLGYGETSHFPVGIYPTETAARFKCDLATGVGSSNLGSSVNFSEFSGRNLAAPTRKPSLQVGSFPIEYSVVYRFKDSALIPAIHTTVWQHALTSRIGAEEWFPVVSLDDASLGLGTAFVLSYDTQKGFWIYGGLIGQVEKGKLPIGGVVVGIRGSFGG